jgi:CDP-diacylglycerol--glycerol-3-phosphate 3-phosphatidyltransferase
VAVTQGFLAWSAYDTLGAIRLEQAVPINLPNILTLLRVAAIPLLVVLAGFPHPVGTLMAAALFGLAAITDWIDGWLARRSGQMTAFGAFLDPVADKLIVATALVLLTDRFDHWLITVSACVIIGREIVVSALREWMAQLGQAAAVKVSTIAKVKTAMQMIAISALLALTPLTEPRYLYWLAVVVLLVAVVLTLWSMVIYLQVFLGAIKEQESP